MTYQYNTGVALRSHTTIATYNYITQTVLVCLLGAGQGGVQDEQTHIIPTETDLKGNRRNLTEYYYLLLKAEERCSTTYPYMLQHGDGHVLGD